MAYLSSFCGCSVVLGDVIVTSVCVAPAVVGSGLAVPEFEVFVVCVCVWGGGGGGGWRGVRVCVCTCV